LPGGGAKGTLCEAMTERARAGLLRDSASVLGCAAIALACAAVVLACLGGCTAEKAALPLPDARAAVQPAWPGQPHVLPEPSLPQLSQLGLPPIPGQLPPMLAYGVPRGGSAEQSETLSGIAYFDKAASAVDDGPRQALALNAGTRTASWGMYRFSGLLPTDAHFGVSIAASGGAAPLPQSYWAGVADYGRGAWRWFAVAAPAGEDFVPVPDSAVVANAFGDAYVAVVAYDTVQATLLRVTLYRNIEAPPPVGFGASDGASGSTIMLAWTDPALTYPPLSYDGVRLERALAPSGPYTALATVAAGVTAYSDVHDGAGNVLPYDTPVYYRARTVVHGTPGNPCAANAGYRLLADVSGLSASDGTHALSIALAWNAVAGAGSYAIEYRNSQGGNPPDWTALATTGPSPAFSHASDSPPGKEAAEKAVYAYRVKAMYLGDQSLAWSSEETGYRNALPVAELQADKTTGTLPLSVNFDASGSYDPGGGSITLCEWDWEGDGAYDASAVGPVAQHIYAQGGAPTPTVRVTDDEGDQATASVALSLPGWQHTWGGSADDLLGAVAVDASGYAYVAGATLSSGAGGYDVLLLKYDPAGNHLFSKTWGGAGNDYGRGVALGGGGSVYIAGSLGGASDTDVLLLKYTADGTLVWAKAWDGGGDDDGYGLTYASSKLWVAGQSNSFTSGNYEALTLSFDEDGAAGWQKTWGGNLGAAAYSVALDAGGAVYLTGIASNEGNPLNGEVLLLRYSDQGDLDWQKRWGGSASDSGFGIVLDAFGAVYVAGQTVSFGAGSFDTVLLKFGVTGGILWQRTWGGTQIDGAASVLLSAGNPILTGLYTNPASFKKCALLTAVDPAGELLWTRAWSHEQTAMSDFVAATAGDSLYLCGNAADSAGGWFVPAGSLLTPTGTLADYSGTAQNRSGVESDATGTEGAPSGVDDSGGGGLDALTILFQPPP